MRGRAADVWCVLVCTHAEILSLPLPVKLVDACALPSLFLCLRNISTSYELNLAKIWWTEPWPRISWYDFGSDLNVGFLPLWMFCWFFSTDWNTVLCKPWKIQQAEGTTNAKYNVVSPPISINLNNDWAFLQLYKLIATISVLLITFLQRFEPTINYLLLN